MTKYSSRKYRGLVGDVREADRAEARRSGKRLGAWLDEVIRDAAGADESEEDWELDEEGKIDAIARRLARSEGGREWRRQQGIRREDDETRRRSSNERSGLRAAEGHERDAAHALDKLAGVLESGARHGAAAEEGLAYLARRLGRIESRLGNASDGARPLYSALSRLEARLDRLTGDRPLADIEQALDGLDRRLAEISQRLEFEPGGRARPVPDAAERAEESERNAALGLDEAVAAIRRRRRILQEGASPHAEEPDIWNGEPPAKRFAAVHASLDLLAERLESVRQDAAEHADQQLVAMRLVEGLRRDAEAMSRAIGDLAPRASVAAIETALRDLARRVEAQRCRGVAEDLLAPAERIAGELRAVIRELDPSPILRTLHADIETIGRRLDALQNPGAAADIPVERLAAQTHEIREQLAALAARPLPLEKIETRLVDLARRVEELARPGEGVARASVVLDMDALARSIRAIVSEETSSSLDTFNCRLEALAGKLDSAAASVGAARFDELGARIEELGRTLASRIDAGAAQKPAEAASLENLVAGLGKKIDSALGDHTHAPVLEEIGRKIERLETRLPDASAAQSIERIEAMLAAPETERRFDDLAERIDCVRDVLAQKLEQESVAAPPAVIEPIKELVCGLDQKIERMQAALADRADESLRVKSRQDQLAGLVEQLAQRLDQAIDPLGDSEALKALEKQIGALSRRLELRGDGGAALSSIEARIGALVAQMEETNATATLAAEEAVRRATQEMLRHARPEPGVLREALERELADIRNLQDQSGQRTHETLLAVHETLERVVDRLALFEDELAEIRAAASAPRERAEPGPLDSPAASGFGAPPGGTPAFAGITPPVTGAARSAPVFESAPAGDPIAALDQPQMDFIAAARRAAKQAAAEAAPPRRAERQPENLAQDADPPPASKAGEVAAAVQERRRPLLLGLGALVLMIGAYQITRVGIEGADNLRQEQRRAETGAPAELGHGSTAAPSGNGSHAGHAAEGVREAAAPTEAPRSSAPSALAPEASKPPVLQPPAPAAPPPRMIAPQAGTRQIDAAPVGSIGGVARPLPAAGVPTAIKALAEQGDPAAQYELAMRLIEGRGLPRDAKSAAQWLEKAAAQGLAPAQYRLGSLYEKGVGVERDYARARKFYVAAAEAGNARAMHNLGVLLAEGGETGKPDYPAAAAWFRKAGELGVRDSQYNLAILYARGLGVDQSLIQSYVWFAAAAAQGDGDATRKREEVASRLDTKELAAAKTLAAALHVREPRREANEVSPPKGGWEVKDPGGREPSGKPGMKPKVSAI